MCYLYLILHIKVCLLVNDRYQKTDTDTDISVKKPMLEKPIPILKKFLLSPFLDKLYYYIEVFST